jgi:Protein of unknown function (DUF2851)
MINGASAVEEVQGLYGPFSFTEKALQKIWLRGDFDRGAARLTDSRTVRVLHPGKWNLLGGPDFKGARLVLGNAAEITGDVELHLRASDWLAHRHAEDPAYDRVVLHVVLFPPEPDHVTRSGAGGEIPLLALLPLLPHDLEEFAADESVEALAGKSLASAPEELAALEHQKLLALLRRHAAERWRRKVHFARVRLERLGWETACHHAALETLGYRFNRSPMLRIAERWPLQHWTVGAVGTDERFASEVASWSVQGVRPANHPRVRLRQYAVWARAVPDWPERFANIADAAISPIVSDAGTREVRRRHRFLALRKRIHESVCGGALGGTRLDTFICDALLPLVAARRGASFDFGIWFHWFPGDQPPLLTRVLHQLVVCDGRGQPRCHGFAQGLLDWFIARDARRQFPGGRGA